MAHITESATADQKILIVDSSGSEVARLLKAEFVRHNAQIFISPEVPGNLSDFSVCFFIQLQKRKIEILLKSPFHITKYIFIQFLKNKQSNELMKAIEGHSDNHTKLIIFDTLSQITKEEIEKILWFTYSDSNETVFRPRTATTDKKEKTKSYRNSYFQKITRIQPSRIPFIILGAVLIAHVLFIPFLLISSYEIYQGAKALTAGSFERTLSYTRRADVTLNLAQKLYGVARPTLLIFSVAGAPDNLFQLDQTGSSLLRNSITLYQDTQNLTSLIFKKDKSQSEKKTLIQEQNKIEKEVNDLQDNMDFLNSKLPDSKLTAPYKQLLSKTSDTLDIVTKVLPNLDDILAKDSKKTYLLLFANNMELRPGGGFIGSFGIAHVEDFTIQDLKVYDVYDADGQLKEHIDPPDPIRKYLSQPNWFLRDVAFSPDFNSNNENAATLLFKELNYQHFDGAFLITTTTIQNILDATGNLYIPDYQENVNKDNFYLKAQLYAQKDFFPGSTQKKQFLTEVTDQLLLKLETSFNPSILFALKKSLDEKQIVAYFDNATLQDSMNTLYWSGRVIGPVCTDSSFDDNCITDYLFPYDANVGVNKANFFVKHTYQLKTTIKKDGSIQNLLNVKISNQSPNDVFPGGTYKNYFQVMIPKSSILKEITVNKTLAEEYDVSEDTYKKVGLYIEIPPQSSKTVSISYTLQNQLKSSKGLYQLIFQKQIGSPNSDLQFELNLAPNVHIVNRNFTGVVKDDTILYNTSLSADKIFLVDVIRE